MMVVEEVEEEVEMMMVVVEVNHDKSTSNDASSCEGVEEDGGVDRKQARGVVGKENPAEEILNKNRGNTEQ